MKRSLKGIMETKMEQSSATNPNPVISVGKDGTVLYSNAAGEPLLHEWGVGVGEKLPSHIEDFVQRVISRNSPEKMEVKAGNRVYLVAFHPLPEEECVNIYGFDISDQKELEEKYRNIVEKSIPCQALLDENHALQDEIQSLRARLEEPEELQRAISEGDLDALVMPVSEEDLMVFTLNSADQAYRILMETANEDVVIVDAEFKITYAGKRLINKTGYSQEEVIGRSWLDFVDEESKAYSELRMEKRRQGIDESYELKLICKNSSPYWVLISSKPLFDENGKFKGALAMLTDITGRKQSEEALRKSEESYRMLFTNMTEAFFFADIICDKDGKPCDYRFLEVNPAYEFVMGIKKEQIIGKSVLELFPNASPTALEKSFDVALSGEPTYFENFSQVTGKFFDVYAFSPEKGKLAAIFRDISERKRGEETLRYHANLVDNVSDAIISTDKDLRIRSWNKAAERLYGWQEDEVIGLKGSDFLQTMFPEELSREAITKDIFEKGIWEGELIQKAKDGRDITVYAKSMALKDEAGGVIGGVSISSDITKRKHIEEKLKQSVKQYQTLGDTIPYGVWITDAEGYCTYASDSFLELLGMSLEQVQKFGWMDRLPPEDVQPTTDHWLHCVQTGEDFEHEHRFRAKDGSYRNVLAIGRPVRNDAGRITEWVGLNLDITERRKMEEALKKAHDSFGGKS